MINHKIPEEFFNTDSINIGKYGKAHSTSAEWYIKNKNLDSSTFKGEFVVKVKYDVFSKQQYSGDGYFNKGDIFCFSPKYGGVMGYPFYQHEEICRLIEIKSLTSSWKKTVDFEGLEEQLLNQ